MRAADANVVAQIPQSRLARSGIEQYVICMAVAVKIRHAHDPDSRRHRLILREASRVAEPMGIVQTFNNPSIRSRQPRIRRRPRPRSRSNRPEELGRTRRRFEHCCSYTAEPSAGCSRCKGPNQDCRLC